MIKHICALILVLSFLLPFAGCTMTEEYPPPMELSDDMPPAPAEDEETESFEATLYFLSSDKMDFKTENRIVSYGGGISRAQAIVDALADGPKNNTTYRSVPSWMTLTRIEQSGDVCNLYFEVEGQFLPDDEAWLKLRACVAASLMATEDIKTVNTRFFEMEWGYYGYPLGAAEVPEDLSMHVRSTKNEYASYHTFGSGIMIDEDTEYLTDTATLYFPVSGEKLLAARGVEITYPERITKSELAEVLIDALAAGDPQQQYENPLPEGFSLACPPIVTYAVEKEPGVPDENSVCTIEIVIEPIDGEYDREMLAGILTMTVSGFIPNVTGVKVSVGEMCEIIAEEPQPTPAPGKQTEPIPEGPQLHILETIGDKTYTHADFSDRIGDVVYVYYPDEAGNVLFSVLRLVPMASLADPFVRLEELFSGSAAPGVPYSGFSSDDIASIYAVDGIAVINWKAGFSEKMRSYLEGEDPIAADRRESMLIYGIVNTLTDIPEVSSVWMLEDGKKLGAIGNIYLGNKLVRNPGLIVEKE